MHHISTDVSKRLEPDESLVSVAGMVTWLEESKADLHGIEITASFDPKPEWHEWQRNLFFAVLDKRHVLVVEQARVSSSGLDFPDYILTNHMTDSIRAVDPPF